MEIVRDSRIGNAVLRRIAKKQGCKGEVYMNSRFRYIEVTDTDDVIKVSFASVVYKGNRYETKYFDGCFSPFLVKMNKAKED